MYNSDHIYMIQSTIQFRNMLETPNVTKFYKTPINTEGKAKSDTGHEE